MEACGGLRVRKEFEEFDLDAIFEDMFDKIEILDVDKVE